MEAILLVLLLLLLVFLQTQAGSDVSDEQSRHSEGKNNEASAR